MTKSLRKTIMTRSGLKNRFNETRYETNWDKYKKQRNFRVSLLRKTKKEYFVNLNIKNISNNKTLRRSVQSFLFGKALNSNSIMLAEKKLLTAEK